MYLFNYNGYITNLLFLLCSIGKKVADVMRNMIVNDSEFYTRVLMYEPIRLSEFTDRFKALGYNTRISYVRDCLNSEVLCYIIFSQS